MKFKPGVLTGEEVTELLNHANKNQFALPAANVIGTSSINAVLETAREVNSPVMVQFSNGGAAFNAGKGLSNDGQKAAIAGAVPRSARAAADCVTSSGSGCADDTRQDDASATKRAHSAYDPRPAPNRCRPDHPAAARFRQDA